MKPRWISKHLGEHLCMFTMQACHHFWSFKCQPHNNLFQYRKAVWYKSALEVFFFFSVHHYRATCFRWDTQTIGAAVIAMISSMFSRNQTDLLWMLREEKRLTPPSSSFVRKVMLCAHGVSDSDRFSWTKPNMDRKRNPGASIPQDRRISTGRAVARGSASFKCVRGARSPPPLRLWSKPHLRFLLRRFSPSLTTKAMWNREREDAQLLAERLSPRTARAGVLSCEWVFEAARASQPCPERKKQKKKTARSAHTSQQTSN